MVDSFHWVGWYRRREGEKEREREGIKKREREDSGKR